MPAPTAEIDTRQPRRSRASRILRPSPSLGHRVVAQVIPRLNRSAGPVTPDALKAAVEAKHARELVDGHRTLPTHLVPRFTQRFDLTHDDRDGFRTWIFSPNDRDVTRTIFYCHGGSYMAGIDPFHLNHTTKLARHLGARVVMPDYPLAPEHTWRDSHASMVEQASQWAERAAAHDEKPLALMGDSAGGGYALSVALGMRDAGGEQPGRLVMHAPWVDLSTSTPETAVVAERDPWLDLAKADVYSRWWAGQDDVARWEVSPVFGDLTGLPRALQLYGTRDLLSPGCRLLQRRADEAGWDLTSVEEHDLLHVYGLFPDFVRESRRAFRQVVAFLE